MLIDHRMWTPVASLLDATETVNSESKDPNHYQIIQNKTKSDRNRLEITIDFIGDESVTQNNMLIRIQFEVKVTKAKKKPWEQ